jgi:hypothetical protein
MHAALREAPADAAALAAADSRCQIFTTSGTTKAPKFVCHALAGVVRHAHDVAAGFGPDAPGARVLHALPLCGVFGSACGVLLPFFQAFGVEPRDGQQPIPHPLCPHQSVPSMTSLSTMRLTQEFPHGHTHHSRSGRVTQARSSYARREPEPLYGRGGTADPACCTSRVTCSR